MINQQPETAAAFPYRFAARSQAPAHTSHAVADDLIDLSGGYAYPQCLPDISREAITAARAYRVETMQYSDVLGLHGLRDLIVDYVAQDGIRCERDNVMVVNGAKHGLDLCCRVFLEPGDRVIVTAPTYMTALNILRTHEVAFFAVPQDDQGMQSHELENRLKRAAAAGEKLPKLLFDVPDFHNPTGITTSAERRRELIALAERFGFVIVEDDPYRRIRFEGDPVPPMKSLERSGVVITLGTASKILSPGLRIGWVIASRGIIERLAAHKADGGTSPFNQRIFAELLASNQVAHHIERVKRELRTHRDVMIATLKEHLPAATARVPEGGYYLWLELPPETNADALAGLAMQKGVKVYSGRLSFPLEPTQNALRLCYSYEEPARIRQGILHLAEAFEAMRHGGIDGDLLQAAVAASLQLPSY